MSNKNTLGERINDAISNFNSHKSDSKIYSDISNTLKDLEIESEHGKIGILSYSPKVDQGIFYIVKPQKNLIKRNKLYLKYGQINGTLPSLLKIIDNNLLPGEDLSTLVHGSKISELSKYGLTRYRQLAYPVVRLSEENKSTLHELQQKSIHDIEKNKEKQRTQNIVPIANR